ncbi:hydroxypyruvate isomerase family protein [Planctomycetota bacterium]
MKTSRREVLTGATGIALTGMSGVNITSSANAAETTFAGIQKGRIQQAACRWCYKKVPLETLCAHAQKIGLVGLDLVDAQDWPILIKYGLVSTMTPSHGISKGLNRIEHHEECLAKIRMSIDQTSEAGFKNVICFSGNRDGMDDAEGQKNCAIALKQIVGYAEKKNVMVIMELLNSKRNHKDYMCDRTHWGVELAKQVSSPAFGLLYDIYHMQIQEGDVIATIKESHEYIAHYHTGGVPGRNEIEETQELYYPAIVKTIINTGYKGYMAHEFIPKRQDALTSLDKAVALCDV